MTKFHVGVAVFSGCLLTFVGSALFLQVRHPLLPTSVLEVAYRTESGQQEDGEAYRRACTDLYYVFLPSADHHKWYVVDFDRQWVGIPCRPRPVLGVECANAETPSGVGIDFACKVGEWDWEFVKEGVTFSQDEFSCTIRRKL